MRGIGALRTLPVIAAPAMRSPPDQLSAAIEAVVADFAGMVRRIGWRHRLSDAELDEVMQEVRIRLWRAHLEGEGASEQIARVPASYVYKTAMSAALDLARRRRRRSSAADTAVLYT